MSFYKVKISVVKRGIFFDDKYEHSYIIESDSIENAYKSQEIERNKKQEEYGCVIGILDISEV